MRWIALGIFSLFSILLLWFRGFTRSHDISLGFSRKHLGVGTNAQPQFPGVLVRRVSEVTINMSMIKNLRLHLENSGYDIKWDTVLIIWLLLIAALPVLAAVLFENVLLMAPAAAVAAACPLPAAKVLRRLRTRNIEDQSSGFTGDLALYLQCGIPVERAVDLVAGDYGYPIKEYLDKARKKLSIGTPPEAVLRELAGLLGNRELDLTAETVKTSRETGADISRVMESIGTTIRERAAIKRELKAQTVQGKLSGQLVAALPLLFLFLTAMISRRTLIILFTTVPGLAMLAIAVVLDVAGFLWINRILDIEI